MKRLLITLLILILGNSCFAKTKYLEKDYQKHFNTLMGGQLEYRLDDGTRVDILTPMYAIEVDFAKKWAESVGQALYYGMKTHKTPAVLLILESNSDTKYLKRLETVADKYGIQIFTITDKDLEK